MKPRIFAITGIHRALVDGCVARRLAAVWNFTAGIVLLLLMVSSLLGLAFATPAAASNLTFTFANSGSNLVLTYSGTLSAAGNNNIITLSGTGLSEVEVYTAGSSGLGANPKYFNITCSSGPCVNSGKLFNTSPFSVSGTYGGSSTPFDLYYDASSVGGELYLPESWTPSTAISGTITFSGKSIADIGGASTSEYTVNGSSDKVYVIVSALSSNANLSSLSLSSGTLSPSFSSSTTSYTSSVANGVSSITVTPTVADSTASVTVNGSPVTSGSASGGISLSVGSNTITTLVTAQDGSTKTYTTTVTRLPPAPSITSLSPNHGPTAGGISIQINGSNLDGTTSVTFGGTTATITNVASSRVDVTAPAGSGTVTVTLTTPGGSATSSFSYDAAVITTVNPTSGPTAGNNSVTIDGANFRGVTDVKFGANSGAVTSSTDTRIIVTAPAGTAGAVSVSVTTPSGTTTSNGAYTYTPPAPTVSNVTSSTANGTYGIGNTISIQVNFSAAVDVTGSPQLSLNSGGTASYASGSGTTTLTFSYTVQAGQNSADLDYVATNSLSLNGGTIRAAGSNVDATLTLPTVGSANSLAGSKNIVIDGNVPVVTSVSVPANGTYGTSQNLDFTVNGSEAITVDTSGGTPRIALTVGTATVYASYISGSGTASLVFRYTVAAGDSSGGSGIVVGSTIQANGGTLTDAAGNDLVTTLNSVGSTTAVLVNAIAPSVTLSTVATQPVRGNFVVTATFSSSVTGFTTSTPSVTNGTVAGVTGSGASYNITVTPTTDGTVTISIAQGAVQDSSGNGNTASSPLNVTADLTDPVVTSVTVPANGTYGTGQNLDFTVNTSENVIVDTTGGTPRISLVIGATNVYANYVSGTGSGALVFRYTIVAGNSDNDGITVGALSTNGGTMRDSAGNNLDTTLNSVGSTVGVRVDTAPPILQSSTPSNGASGIAVNTNITLQFNEAVVGSSGNILIKSTVDNSTYETIAANSANVTSGGVGILVINPTTNLLPGTGYYVLVDAGAIVDSYGNPYGGISSAGTLAFSTLTSSDSSLASLAISPGMLTPVFASGTTSYSASVPNGTTSITVTPTVTDVSATVTVNGNPVTSGSASSAINLAVGANTITTVVTAQDTTQTTYTLTVTRAAAVGPSVTLATPSTIVTGPFVVTATFTAAVTGVSLNAVTVNNGVASALSGSGAVYSFTVTPAASGAVSVQVAAGAGVDGTGGQSLASNILLLTSNLSGPTATVTGPSSTVTGPFAITVKFSSAVSGFDAADINVTKGRIGRLSVTTPGLVYKAEITPVMGQTVTVRIPANVVQDGAGRGNEASRPFSVRSASPKTLFDQNEDEIRRIVQDQAEDRLTVMMSANGRMLADARDRFMGLTAGPFAVAAAGAFDAIDFDVDGNIDVTGDINGVVATSSGGFLGQTGLVDGVNWRTSGSFDVLVDDAGSTLGAFDARVAREQLLGEGTLLGTFAGGQFTGSDINDEFSGNETTWTAYAGLYGVQKLSDHFYADGYASIGYGWSALDMQNDSLSLNSNYGTLTWQVGGTLTGLVDLPGFDVLPTLALAYGNSNLGEINFDATAFGMTEGASLDAGNVAMGVLRLTPEIRLPLSGTEQGATVGLLPSLICEQVVADGVDNTCGWGAGIQIMDGGRLGPGQFSGRFDFERVGDVNRIAGQIDYALHF